MAREALARRDPAVRAALRAMEADPARGWTVARLARDPFALSAAFLRERGVRPTTLRM